MIILEKINTYPFMHSADVHAKNDKDNFNIEFRLNVVRRNVEENIIYFNIAPVVLCA